MPEKIKRFYEKGLWTAAMVRQAVDKGLLTEEQYRQIVGPQTGDGGKEAEPDAGGGVAEPDAAEEKEE